MAARYLLKKAACRLVVLLCLISSVSASVPIVYQPAVAIHDNNAEIFNQYTMDFFKGSFCRPSLARLQKIGSLKPDHPAQLASPNLSGEVTASWYGHRHHNKPTASGQIFNMHKKTLAHRTLPLGTKVRLVNPVSGKSAEGVVNDRGPYIKGRDVDVSYAIAKQLGFVKKGVVKLDMETI